MTIHFMFNYLNTNTNTKNEDLAEIDTISNLFNKLLIHNSYDNWDNTATSRFSTGC